MRRDLLILIAAVVLARLPFIDEPIQGDDAFYLLIAENARVDPLHPLQFGFRLAGDTVWAAGHTRPPGNAYVLAGLIELFGGVREVPFHLAYAGFSLIAVFSMYFLARRFQAPALWAGLLFLAVPAVMVNGNKLESDLPMLAFWTLGFALFFHGRFAGAAAALTVSGFFGYQAVAAVPILAHWIFYRDRRNFRAWASILVGPAALVAWQLFERQSTGTAPAAVLAGYFSSYGLTALRMKLVSGMALLGHLGWMLSPAIVLATWNRRLDLGAAVVLGLGLGLAAPGEYAAWERGFYAFSAACGLMAMFAAARALWASWTEEDGFLGAWLLVFFGASLAIFYAGSARYLLPLAPAVILLVLRAQPARQVLIAGLALHLPLGLALAKADYDYAQDYRRFADDIQPLVGSKRLWTNGEWGLRHYLGRLGGEQTLDGQQVQSGSILVESALAEQIPVEFAEGRVELMQRDVTTGAVPLNLLGLGSHSGYASSGFGVLPFGIGPATIDTLTVYSVGGAEPTVSYLKMDAPEADEHLLSGFFPPEGQPWRWMAPRGALTLKVPDEGASKFELHLYIPETAPARRIEIEINGRSVGDVTLDRPEGHVIEAPVDVAPGASARVVIRASPGHRPPGDDRELAIVVSELGFRGP